MSEELCVVCYSPGAKKHFGELCCSGCQGFFRRSIRYRRDYICNFDNNCNIHTSGRNTCRKCRLRICLERGLRPERVFADRAIDLNRPWRKKCEEKGDSDSNSDINNNKQLQLSLFDQNNNVMIQQECNQLVIRCLNEPIFRHLPLGARKVLSPFDKNDINSVLHYLVMSDRLVDNYFDNPRNLFEEDVKINLKLNVEEAFYYKSGALCERTHIGWQCDKQYKLPMIPKIFARWTLYYIDWINHLRELDELDFDDRLRMLVGRCVPLTYNISALKTIKLKQRRMLCTSGIYVQVGDEDNRRIVNGIRDACIENSEIFFNNFIDPLKEINVTDAELHLLRVIAFFSPVPRLSEKGRKIIQEAQRFYNSVLYKVICQENPAFNPAHVAERMSSLLCIVPSLEITSEIEETFFTVMSIHNFDLSSKNLIHEFYIQKRLR